MERQHYLQMGFHVFNVFIAYSCVRRHICAQIQIFSYYKEYRGVKAGYTSQLFLFISTTYGNTPLSIYLFSTVSHIGFRKIRRQH